MVLTDKIYLKPDIWPKTSKQAENIENIIITIKNINEILWQKTNRKPNCLLFSINKEVKYMHTFLLNN